MKKKTMLNSGSAFYHYRHTKFRALRICKINIALLKRAGKFAMSPLKGLNKNSSYIRKQIITNRNEKKDNGIFKLDCFNSIQYYVYYVSY